MSVIIEGLTLPKHNPKEIDKNVLIGYAIVKEDNTAELCLEGVRYLIKMLPTPHSRLIDADKLQTAIHGCLCENCQTFPCEKGIGCLIEDVFNLLDEAPTIIEAEVSK